MPFAGCHRYRSVRYVSFFPELLIAMWMVYSLHDCGFSWVYYSSIASERLSLEYQFLCYGVGVKMFILPRRGLMVRGIFGAIGDKSNVCDFDFQR